LTDECVDALKIIGSKAKKTSEILANKNDPVYEAINAGV
jgi:hypothetical protein